VNCTSRRRFQQLLADEIVTSMDVPIDA